MFIAASFVIAKTYKQPKYPSVGEWLNTLWYIHIMECFPAIKRNKLLIYTATGFQGHCCLVKNISFKRLQTV